MRGKFVGIHQTLTLLAHSPLRAGTQRPSLPIAIPLDYGMSRRDPVTFGKRQELVPVAGC